MATLWRCRRSPHQPDRKLSRAGCKLSRVVGASMAASLMASGVLTGLALSGVAATALAAASPGTASASPLPGAPDCEMFPPDNVWNTPIASLPVDPHSAEYIAAIGPDNVLHPDFGQGDWDGEPMGIPYNVVPGSQPKVPVTFMYASESNPGPYPIPRNAQIEGGLRQHNCPRRASK